MPTTNTAPTPLLPPRSRQGRSDCRRLWQRHPRAHRSGGRHRVRARGPHPCRRRAAGGGAGGRRLRTCAGRRAACCCRCRLMLCCCGEAAAVAWAGSAAAAVCAAATPWHRLRWHAALPAPAATSHPACPLLVANLRPGPPPAPPQAFFAQLGAKPGKRPPFSERQQYLIWPATQADQAAAEEALVAFSDAYSERCRAPSRLLTPQGAAVGPGAAPRLHGARRRPGRRPQADRGLASHPGPCPALQRGGRSSTTSARPR